MTALERLVSGDAHRQDEDCIIDPDTNLCISCGVARGDACPDCGARSFHREWCHRLLTITEAIPDQEAESAEERAERQATLLVVATAMAALIFAVFLSFHKGL
ncbi:MAG: hypothetical protein KGL39_27455 [Patescibacteria group bacterium]|nr:hypothetical protein [Patescibacteria group bacterium]